MIGGQRAAVRAVVAALGCSFLELPMVSTVHCEIGRAVEQEYRALHDHPTESPADLVFYSGVSSRAYRPDRNLAADAITAQATQVVDFPAVIDQAYADGFRVFLEIGPGGSCTRLMGRILAGRPHLAHAVCAPARDALETVLETLGRLIAWRIPVNLQSLHGVPTSAADLLRETEETISRNGRRITVPPGPRPPQFPPLPRRRRAKTARTPVFGIAEESSAAPPRPRPVPPREATPTPALVQAQARVQVQAQAQPAAHELPPLVEQLARMEAATAGAHGAYLEVSSRFVALMSEGLAHQISLAERLAGTQQSRERDGPSLGAIAAAEATACVLDRSQCLEFAIGSIARVLGPDFAPIDGHPTRVRLPDEPLMLVDRITAIEGEPRSLSHGRVVTEHDILPGDWYLDAGKIPPSIAIESGQADLFLSAFLGIDLVTQGLAVYRLLDATVTFHRALPGPGQVIRYDIKITRFFRQGETHLFRFEFDGTVDGEPLLSMRDGCAGFFSAAELAAGKGVVPRPLDARPRAGVKPADWTDLVPQQAQVLDDGQIEALRRGDLSGAFGAPFDRINLRDPLPLPGGRMTLVHRVLELNPTGGRFGLGLIRAEADIHPGDWFMVCHFVDDRVMPGTLMYECCLHTLRILLMRLGWIGQNGRVAYEPLPGVANRLRCRGQVVESTRKVVYEVTVKELGYGPEPFAIADALMYADGKPIVEISDMALRLSGTSRSELEQLWKPCREPAPAAAPVLYGKEQILAFATGKPSAGFGDRYRVFDDGRFIARLPRPPYSFLDRIVGVQGDAWTMAAGTSAVAEYDIPPDAWYFQADRQDRVPYAVLLEAASRHAGGSPPTWARRWPATVPSSSGTWEGRPASVPCLVPHPARSRRRSRPHRSPVQPA